MCIRDSLNVTHSPYPFSWIGPYILLEILLSKSTDYVRGLLASPSLAVYVINYKHIANEMPDCTNNSRNVKPVCGNISTNLASMIFLL